ncbi:MAG: tetratricopeptide repeat protein [Verrucomicrobia bacterium]|nr:tetratricopeptide repeat protein [Verrucomicrobiota bacterium]
MKHWTPWAIVGRSMLAGGTGPQPEGLIESIGGASYASPNGPRYRRRKPFTGLALLLLLAAFILLPALQSHAVIAGAAERLQFADGLYKRGMYDLAVREYEGLLDAAVKAEIADVALFRMGESYRFLGQSTKALAAYARLLAEYPDSLFAHRAAFRRAELAFQQEDYETAGGWFDDLLAANPPADIAASAHYYKGLAYLRRGLDQDAESSFRMVIKNFKRSPFASYAAMSLAELLVKQQAPANKIRSLYRQVADRPETAAQGAEALARWMDLEWGEADYSKVLALYDQLVNTYPGDSRARSAASRAALASLYAGRPELALELAGQGLAQASGDEQSNWLYIQANALRLTGQADQAMEVYRDVLRQAEGDTRRSAAIELAALQIERGEYAAVLTLLSPLDEQGARAGDRRWMLALAYSETGRLKEAERLLHALLDDKDEASRRASVLFELARVAQRDERWEDMAVRYEQFARDYKTNPLAAAAFDYAGTATRRLGQNGRARILWETLLKTYPDYENRESVSYRLASTLIEMEEYDAARTVLDDLIRDFPDGEYAADALYQRGQLMEQEEQYEAADYQYQSALRLNPGEPLLSRLRFRRIAVLQRLGRGADAAEMLKAILTAEQTPDIPEPLVEWLARWNLEQERYADAAQAAVYLSDTSKDLRWQQLGWFMAGVARFRDGLTGDAIVALEKAVAADVAGRERAEAALLLGQAHQAEGDLDQAEQAYRQAAEWAGDDANLDIKASAYFDLGALYRDRDNPEEAARFFMSVAVLFDDPEQSPEALYQASEAFAKLGREQDRRHALQELQERYPDHPRAQEQPPGDAAPPAEQTTPESTGSEG